MDFILPLDDLKGEYYFKVFLPLCLGCFLALVYLANANSQGKSILRVFLIVAVLTLPVGFYWASGVLNKFYKLECSSGKIFIWLDSSNTPQSIYFDDISSIRVGMTSSKGDSWVIRIWLKNGSSHTSFYLKNKRAKNIVRKMNKVVFEGEDC